MRESDFIAAINADPDNRDLQLVYADWLDQQAESASSLALAI